MLVTGIEEITNRKNTDKKENFQCFILTRTEIVPTSYWSALDYNIMTFFKSQTLFQQFSEKIIEPVNPFTVGTRQSGDLLALFHAASTPQ